MLHRIVPFFAATRDNLLIMRINRIHSKLSKSPESLVLMHAAQKLSVHCARRAEVRATRVARFRGSLQGFNLAEIGVLARIDALEREISVLEEEGKKACADYLERAVAERCGQECETLEGYGDRIGKAIARGHKLDDLRRKLARENRTLKGLRRERGRISRDASSVEKRIFRLRAAGERNSFMTY